MNNADKLDAPIIIVMGVSGTGKSTIATTLAKKMGAEFIEGDALHPKSNIDAMSAGIPLTDEMRWPWLLNLVQTVQQQHDKAPETPVIATCSALKRSYRDLIRASAPSVIFLYLHADPAVIRNRMESREGHFMPTKLLDSQFKSLQPPTVDEPHIKVDVDAPLDEIAELTISALGCN